jgi:hypothetical protein
MTLGADLMRSKVCGMAYCGDETSTRICSTSDDEGYVWREHAFGATGKDGDSVFGDNGFPDGLCECAGEVVDAAVT